MKKIKFCLLSFSCLAFFCLFLSGAQRLISVQEAPEEEERTVHQAYLCASVSSAPEAGRQAKSGHFDVQQFRAHPLCPQEPIKKIGSDANGNVLVGARSYLHIVYQAFPLGDGFA